MLPGGEQVTIHLMNQPQFSVSPNPDVPFEVIREDRHFLVVYKPAGVVTQPGVKHEHDALLNGLFDRYGKKLQNLGKARDYGLLHRLDRPTSGLLLIGLTPEGYDGLRLQFGDREIEKTYLALTHGAPQPPGGQVTLPIREEKVRGRKRASLRPGRGAKEALTRYSILTRSGRFSLIKCHPKTGRLHQIRVHMASLGCPIVGDTDYGKREPIDRRLGPDAHCLHAAQLSFRHPVRGRKLTVKAPFPEFMESIASRVAIECPPKWR